MPLGKGTGSADEHRSYDLGFDIRADPGSMGAQQIVLHLGRLLTLNPCIGQRSETCGDSVYGLVILNNPLHERSGRLHASVKIVTWNGDSTPIRNGHHIIHREW
jgi:hypothetical protein